MGRHLPGVLFITTLVVIQAGHLAADEVLRQRFLKEAPQGWNALRRTIQNLRGGYEEKLQIQTPPGYKIKPMTRQTRYDVCLRAEAACAKVEFTKNGKVAIRCINPDYEFGVTAPPEKNVFSLDNYEGQGLEEPEPKLPKWATGYFEDSYSLGQFTLPEMLEREDCKLISVEPVDYESASMVRVDFDWFPEGAGTGRRYWATLDPENNWAVRSNWREGDGKYVSKNTTKIEYTRRADGAVFPKRLENFGEMFDSPGYGSRKIVTFDPPHKLGLCDMPPSAFTLTAYGLPEIPEESRGRLYTWLVLGSLTVLIGSALLASWIRRRQA